MRLLTYGLLLGAAAAQRPCGIRQPPCPSHQTCSPINPSCTSTRPPTLCPGTCKDSICTVIIPAPPSWPPCAGNEKTTYTVRVPPFPTEPIPPPPPASTPAAATRTTTASSPTGSLYVPRYQSCGGNPVVPPPPCPSGYLCIDNPRIAGCGMACDRPGICVPPGPFCGGFGNLACPEPWQVCAWDPRGGCDPTKGGRDCGGFCV